MRCPSCGTKCRSSRTHCPKCGVPLDPKVAAFGGAARSVREAWGLEARTETVVVHHRPPMRYVAFGAAAFVLVAALVAVVATLQFGNMGGAERRLDDGSLADGALIALLASYDTDGDGALSPAEASTVTDLDCSDRGLTSLEGIELFTNLKTLDASGNNLEAVDLAGLAALESVDLSGNRIAKLDLAGHASLVSLDVSDNGMGTLDLDGRTALVTLHCTGNSLARVDLADCTSLAELACDEGQNVTVPIAANFFPDAGLRAALTSVDANGDGALTLRERQNVTSLTVDDPATGSLFGLAWFENLAVLDVHGTSLTALDLAELPAVLTELDASDCQIESADLSQGSHLTVLDLSGNPLESVDTSALVRLTELDLSDCRLSGTLSVAGNTRLAWLDVTGNPDLALVDAGAAEGLAATGALMHDETCSTQFATAAVTDAATAEAQDEGAGTEGAAEQQAGETAEGAGGE